ncbi:MAG: S9 family peptidase [Candidatus Heimdallarchaeota archaeon]|nr:S9 family peptidase [Candidatus Heimdallarchaeota archaeon]
MNTFDEEKFEENLTPIMKTPIVLSLIGHSKRNDFLYVSTEKEGVPMLYWWGEGNMIKQLSSEHLVDVVALHPEKPWVIIKKDVGGTENYSLNLFDFSEEGKMTQITKNPIGNITDVFWIDNEHLLVIGFDDDQYFIRKINLNGQMVEIFTTNEQILNSDFNNEQMLLATGIGRRFTKIAIIDIKKAKVITWIELSKDSSCSFPAFSSKGQLAYTSDLQKTHDEIIIESIERPDGNQKFTVPGFVGFWPFDKNAIQWIDEEKLSIFVGKNGRMLLYILDSKNNSWTEVTNNELNLDKAIVTNDGIVWIGSSLKHPEVIHKFSYGKNIKLLDMGKDQLEIFVESHWYQTFDGRKIQGWLVKNLNPKAPLLIYCHGGPTFANTNNWDIFITSLVLAGFTVFAPNFRGSTTFGSEFKDLNIGEFGRGDLNDVLYGAQYIQKLLDYVKLPMIFGASHGGFLTLRALTTQPDNWLGGVALMPMADLEEAYELANSHYRSFLEHFLDGSPEEKRGLYKEFSPITYVNNLKAPLFVFHGANDPRCPVSSIRRFYAEAKKRNLPIELIVADDEGHGSEDVKGYFNVLKLSAKYLLSLINK